jgi:hypothetical protein
LLQKVQVEPGLVTSSTTSGPVKGSIRPRLVFLVAPILPSMSISPRAFGLALGVTAAGAGAGAGDAAEAAGGLRAAMSCFTRRWRPKLTASSDMLSLIWFFKIGVMAGEASTSISS